VDPSRSKKKRTTEKHLKNRSGEGNVDSRLQVQLDVDGDEDGSTRQSCMEMGGLLWSDKT